MPNWRDTILALALGILLGLGIYFFGTKACRPDPIIVDAIDAGPGLAEIAEEQAGAEHAAKLRLDAIERKRLKDLEALNESERKAYETIREKGPDAVLGWLRDFDRERFEP